MHDYFDYNQLNCRLDDDVIAATPSFGHKTDANVFDEEGAFLFWVLSRRHYFTSPQNGIIPFFRHSRTSPVDGTFRLFW